MHPYQTTWRQSTPGRVMCRTMPRMRAPVRAPLHLQSGRIASRQRENMKQKFSGTCGKKTGSWGPTGYTKTATSGGHFMRLLEVMQAHRHCCAVVCSLEERFLCLLASVAHCQSQHSTTSLPHCGLLLFSRSMPRTRRRQGDGRPDKTAAQGSSIEKALSTAYRAVDHQTQDLTAGNSP